MPKVERLPSGSYRIRYTDPWGRRAVITRKTAADVRAVYKRVLGDMARGEYTDPRRARITLAQWADDWLAGARNLSTGGRETYRRDLDRYILPKLGKVPLGKLSAGDIDTYLNEIGRGLSEGFEPSDGMGTTAFRAGSPPRSSPAHRLSTPATAGLAPSTVHRHYRTIHRMLEVARLRGLIARNPAEPVEPPVVPRRERPVLDPLQVDALADAIADRYRAWVYVMCYAGLRWSECVGLRRMDVDGPRLMIGSQLIHRGRGLWERVDPKAGSRRSVTLPDFAAVELVAHLATYRSDGTVGPGPEGYPFAADQRDPLARPADDDRLPGSLDGLVFPTRNGTPVQSPSFTANVFKRALRKASLPDLRIHDLRHTAVSLAIEAGVNPKVGQARAGHASSALHMDGYGHLYPGADEAVAVKLAELRAAALRGRLRAV